MKNKRGHFVRSFSPRMSKRGHYVLSLPFHKGKKGFLLAEETLKMILALISIGILAFLLFSIYGAREDAKNLELARESLDRLVQEINADATEVEIYNPSGWWIVSWPGNYEEGFFPFKETRSNGMPKSCENLGWSSCVCICDDASPNKCDSMGACFENQKLFSLDAIQIENPPVTLNLNYDSRLITSD
ncbi:MAG: hypothetical protein Q8P81_02150 [Nanoarchaeota archaeon]|nr:hypothetical protein [Nanoarchaeota archaeon]